MATIQPYRIKTISEYHDFRNLPKPAHSLISVINFDDIKLLKDDEPKNIVLDFYSITLKRCFNGIMKYGQQECDFNEGVMFFIAPGQVFSVASRATLQHSGWGLLVHPDFFWNTPLAKAIKKYEFFNYSVFEALYLSEKEETIVTAIVQNIEQEYQSNIDRYSQNVMVSQIELLLTYAERFYNRQFITRSKNSHKLLERLEDILSDYFNDGAVAQKGLPSVHDIAQQLNTSPGYLSSMLKSLTGQSTQQHIHDKLIEKAKEKLTTTSLSVGEIAFLLGFEHSQSFSKLFKTKTSLSPLEFRETFN